MSSNLSMNFTLHLHGKLSVDAHIKENRCNDIDKNIGSNGLYM